MMKKLILILLTALFSPQVFAFEDYVVLSDNPVISADSSNENVMLAKTLYSIDNNKNIILIKAKNCGKTILTIETIKDTFNIDVEIKENETKLSENEGFTYYALDIPDDKPIIRGK